MNNFTEIVEKVSALPLEEMQAVEIILHEIIMKKKAIEIISSQKESKKMYEDGSLKFYTTPDDLLNALNEEE